MRHHHVLQCVSWLCVLAAVAAWPVPARAAWLSEIFLGQTSGVGMPNAIEISGFGDLERVELVVMDAHNSDRLGQVRQVLRFEATHGLHLISDGDWPTTPWTEDLKHLPAGIELDVSEVSLWDQTQLDLAGPRRIHLYAGWSNIQSQGVNLLHPTSGPQLVGSATLLDVLSVAEHGQASTLHDDELVLNASDGWVFVRPRGYASRSAEQQWLVGSPDAAGNLLPPSGKAPVTPGMANPHFDDVIVPAPQSVAVMLIAGGVMAFRRARAAR